MLYDYGMEIVCWSEYGAIVESQRGLMAQYQEDCKLLLEEGSLCRGLEGYYQDPAETAAKLDKRFQVYCSNFLQGGEHVEFQKLLSVQAVQNAPWGGELRQLTEDLQEYSSQGYCTMLCAAGKKRCRSCSRTCRKAGSAASWRNRTACGVRAWSISAPAACPAASPIRKPKRLSSHRAEHSTPAHGGGNSTAAVRKSGHWRTLSPVIWWCMPCTVSAGFWESASWNWRA